MVANDFFQSATVLYALLLTVVAAVAIVLYLRRDKIRHLWLVLKTRRRLNGLGLQQLSNFRCPDGLGDYYTIDRLLLCRDGISLLQFKQFPGSIFCSEHIDEWTQMLGGKSYHFKNPLFDLDFQIKAVSACIPGVPVNGFLFFDHSAEFPKGRPDRVIQLEDVPQSVLCDGVHEAEASVMKAWEKLRTFKRS